jgi:teichuronic acid biosynthesis glycosyltransferase TuaC
MKVLFVSSGNSNGDPKEVVKNQGLSLADQGAEVKFFCVGKGGLAGYIRSLPELRRVIKSFNPDVTHAHYSFSGFLSSLAGAKPLVVSLMGSEAFTKKAYRNIISFFERKIWSVTLVKTEQMAARLKLKSAVVLPNGVDINLFGTIEKKSAVERTGWSEQKIIYFLLPIRRGWRKTIFWLKGQ